MQSKILKVTFSLFVVLCIATSCFSVKTLAESAQSENTAKSAVDVKNNATTAKINNKVTAKKTDEKKTVFDITEFSFPLSGDTATVTSAYGWRTIYGVTGFHAGIDLDAVTGERVNSFKSGKVYKVMKEGSASWGNYIIVYHGKYKNKKLYTGYAHLDSISVKKGDTVKQGQKIGTAGNTGRSFGTHLHFEVYLGGTDSAKPTSKSSYFEPDRVNPAAYIGLINKKGEQKITNESLVEEKATTPHIKASAVSNSTVNVKWAATDSRKHKLQQKTTNGKWKTVKITDKKTYKATSLKVGKTYSFRVKTYYKDNHSAYSDAVSFSPLAKIENVKATMSNNSTVQLKWENIKSAKEYFIYSKVGNGKWQKKAQVSKNSYSNKNLMPNTTIKYKVKAVCDGAEGNSSNALAIHTLSESKISFANICGSTVTINYDHVTYATGYNIYRKGENDRDFIKIGSSTDLQYVDTTAEIGKEYSYKVSAYNLYTESEKSDEYFMIIK